MAEILFRRGTHANLPSTAVDGAFYLTTDSHRLYAGIGTELVDLNQYITILDNSAALTSLTNIQEGDFVYLKAENILAVRSGAAWVQVNKQSADTTVNDFTAAGNGDKLKLTIHNSDSSVQDVEVQFIGAAGNDVSINSATGAVTVTGALYDISGVLSGSKYTVKLGSDKDTGTVPESSFTIEAGNNISLTATDTGVSISTPDEVTLQGGTVSVTAGESGNLTVAVQDSASNSISGTLTGGLYHQIGGITYYNQSELPVYTKTEIDTKINALNPMTYKGTVTTAEELTALNGTAQAGDTYMAAAAFTLSDQSVRIGDLLIATGTEGAGGTLETVTWTYVPSGDDAQIDTTYTATATSSSNTLKIVNDRSSNTLAQISITGDTKLNVTSSASDVGNGTSNGLAVSVAHGNAGAPVLTASKTNLNNATSIVALSAAGVDSTGHVASLTETTYTIPTYSVANSTVAASGNVATVTTTLSDTAGGSSAAALQISAAGDDNLTITGTGNTVSIALEWGEF